MLSFHKEGYKIIVYTFLLILSGILLSEKFVEVYWLQKGIQIFLVLFLIIVLQFFRNPKRITNINDNQIIAPVDGKVVVIEEVDEPEYFKGKKLDIFARQKRTGFKGWGNEYGKLDVNVKKKRIILKLSFFSSVNRGNNAT